MTFHFCKIASIDKQTFNVKNITIQAFQFSFMAGIYKTNTSEAEAL